MKRIFSNLLLVVVLVAFLFCIGCGGEPTVVSCTAGRSFEGLYIQSCVEYTGDNGDWDSIQCNGKKEHEPCPLHGLISRCELPDAYGLNRVAFVNVFSSSDTDEALMAAKIACEDNNGTFIDLS